MSSGATRVAPSKRTCARLTVSCNLTTEPSGARGNAHAGASQNFSLRPISVKRHRGEPGHARDTHGTRTGHTISVPTKPAQRLVVSRVWLHEEGPAAVRPTPQRVRRAEHEATVYG